jgi:hypothetical protein
MGGVLISWTADRLRAGDLQLIWRQRERTAITPPAPTGPAPAPLAPRRRPPPSSTPSPQYSTFQPDLDAAAVAQGLKSAAQAGVPFCEECRKAEQARQSTAGEPAS